MTGEQGERAGPPAPSKGSTMGIAGIPPIVFLKELQTSQFVSVGNKEVAVSGFSSRDDGRRGKEAKKQG